jgi:hypothetical protein
MKSLLNDRSNRAHISVADIDKILNPQPEREYVRVEGTHPCEYYMIGKINFNR